MSKKLKNTAKALSDVYPLFSLLYRFRKKIKNIESKIKQTPLDGLNNRLITATLNFINAYEEVEALYLKERQKERGG
ncbi:hypothetical protein [Kosmotoga pacifica]|uniref:Uncharacterized protein n=1 Tax=Kosmotoga pacifica TaxID=1330330 RepID=A0A0G2Z4N8_9BACT|nr:hypothetical protein [Kosmotoga pacifica]AKI96575.1 hypothetical protein IX53_00655 [Kosmotoga pacifica]